MAKLPVRRILMSQVARSSSCHVARCRVTTIPKQLLQVDILLLLLAASRAASEDEKGQCDPVTNAACAHEGPELASDGTDAGVLLQTRVTTEVLGTPDSQHINIDLSLPMSPTLTHSLSLSLSLPLHIFFSDSHARKQRANSHIIFSQARSQTFLLSTSGHVLHQPWNLCFMPVHFGLTSLHLV